ncbi:MAG: RNA polymerase sigma factor [Stappiaceae bacterium]
MDTDFVKVVEAAQQGDRRALEQVVLNSQDRIYGLARRMLVDPEDALEATQEVLILIVTKLSTFRGESTFSTWTYRIAVNYLVNAKKSRDRDRGLTFEMFKADLETGLQAEPELPADSAVLLNELRISCTMAMLLCLDTKHRVAYVLGDILEMEHAEAAVILDLSKSNYRQRLSRARAKVVEFTSQNCGLANDNARCRCDRRLATAKAAGRVTGERTEFLNKNSPAYASVVEKVRRVEGDLKTLTLQTATPNFRSPRELGSLIMQIVG